ncbi:MAG: RNA polymerase sigma factor [Jatrophihabitans sp.]
MLAASVRLAGDLGLAEDCAQDAFVSAFVAWLRDGIPRNPGAWLTTAARRKVLDAHRRNQLLRAKLPLLAGEAMTRPASLGEDPAELAGADPDHPEDPDGLDPAAFGDDRLRLIFTCCHPALAREAQVALTLRLVCGLSTADISRAFLVSEATMAARVTRAKKKIAAARIPYRVPAGHELTERLDAVLTVLHLVFTAGHAAPSGDQLVRSDLVDRAIGLGRLLRVLMPDEREVGGLLALMLVTDARRATRCDETGALVLLAEQDRSRWDAQLIAEGARVLVDALRGGRPGRFVLQAAIAALHAEAPDYAETDWGQILGLYDLLRLAWPSPVVELNRAVAVGMVAGPGAGLAAIDAIDAGALAGYHYLPAARAELLCRLGRDAEAATEYDRAIALGANAAERRYLMAQKRLLS